MIWFESQPAGRFTDCLCLIRSMRHMCHTFSLTSKQVSHASSSTVLVLRVIHSARDLEMFAG